MADRWDRILVDVNWEVENRYLGTELRTRQVIRYRIRNAFQLLTGVVTLDINLEEFVIFFLLQRRSLFRDSQNTKVTEITPRHTQ